MSKQLESYLSYYKALKRPSFALLVAGRWGVGKTFRINQLLDEGERYYVSLYGLQSADDIHTAVLAAAYPTLTKTKSALEKVEKVAKTLGGDHPLFQAAPKLVGWLAARQIKPDRLLVFDDLERCKMPMYDRLGAINHYVEHLGFNVIVIADDTEFGEQQEAFDRQKEKIFGQTVRITPAREEAYRAFVSAKACAAHQAVFETYKYIILDSFAASGAGSLRVLRHLILDLARFFDCLEKKHLADNGVMDEALRLFCALSLETRLGRIKEPDLRDREKAWFLYHMDKGKPDETRPLEPSIHASDQRYLAISLDSDLLSDDVLVEMLINGVFPAEQIKKCLDGSRYLTAAVDLPAWRVLYRHMDHDQEALVQALQRLETGLASRSVTIIGEMLHVFAMRLMLAENDVIDKTLDDVEAECVSYIDELLRSGALPPRSTEWNWADRDYNSYMQQGYYRIEGDQSHFERIQDHLKGAQQKALEAKFPELGAELLEFLRETPRRFFEAVSPTNNGENVYAYVPVLADIQPSEFLAAWLAGPESAWLETSYALEGRYEGPDVRPQNWTV